MKKLLTGLLALALALYSPAFAATRMQMTGFGVVASGGGALACSYTPVTIGTQGTAYTGATPSASGGTPTYTFSETGTLPGGLSINSSTGVISGTPTASGTFPTIQVKVTDSASTVANCGSSFTLTISPSGGTTPAFVQGNSIQLGNNTPGTSASVTLPSVVSSGGTVFAVFCASLLTTSDAVSFFDDTGDSFTNVFPTPIINSLATYGCQMGYTLNSTTGPKTITGGDTTGRNFISLVAGELSNILASGAVDGAPQSSIQNSPSTSANAITTPSVTTAANGDLVVGFTVSIGSTGMSYGTGTNTFTGQNINDATSTFYVETLVQMTAGAIPATFTAHASGDNTITFTIAFKHS